MKKYVCYTRIVLYLITFVLLLLSLTACADAVKPAQTNDGTTPVTEFSSVTDGINETSIIVSEVGSKDLVASIEPREKLLGRYDDIEAYTIVVEAEQGELQVLLTIPKNYDTVKCPAILWLPDATIFPTRFAEISYYGYAVFTVYSRGYRDSRSVGDYGCGNDSDVNDIDTLMRLIRSCSFVDQNRLFAVASQNECFSVGLQRYIMENEDTGIKAVALANPIADVYEYFKALTAAYPANDWIPEFFVRDFGGLPEQVPQEYDKRSSIKNIDKINVPLLVGYFKNGEVEGRIILDRQSSVGFVEALTAAGKNVTEKQFDFGGTDFYAEESIGYLIEWLHQFQ